MRKEREIRRMYHRLPMLVSILLMSAAVVSSARAQGNDDESILPGVMDSSYFTPWAVKDTMTQEFLEGSPYVEVFGYPSITAIDIDRAKKTGMIQADRSFRLYGERTILHCAGDSVERVRISRSGVQQLMDILNDPMSYSAEEFACYFLPRHTFTFVNDKGGIAGVVELCFECGQIRMSPDHVRRSGHTTLTKKALQAFEELCEQERLFPPGVRTACWFYFSDRR